MKAYAVLTLFGAASAAALPAQNAQESRALLDRRQGPLDLLQGFNGYGKVDAPHGAVPTKEILQPISKVPGAKRIKIRSGPYKVPGMNAKSPAGHAGMLENWSDRAVEKPCTECVILRQEAGLEYTDGVNANIDTGMWLHHMVHLVTGANKWDPTAYDYDGTFCQHNIPFRTTSRATERYFTSGNERTPVNFNAGGNTGFQLDKDDTFGYLVELMNMNMGDKVVYLTMTYDYLEGTLPQGWEGIKTFWLDAKQCRDSEVEPVRDHGDFTIQSLPWRPNFNGGRIITAMGHVHDGGTKVELISNYWSGPAKNLCTAEARYSETPQYVYKGMEMGEDKVAKDHISGMPGCTIDQFETREFALNQTWVIKGHYNYDDKEGNLEHGKQSLIMALGIVSVAVPPGRVQPTRSWGLGYGK